MFADTSTEKSLAPSPKQSFHTLTISPEVERLAFNSEKLTFRQIEKRIATEFGLQVARFPRSGYHCSYEKLLRGRGVDLIIIEDPSIADIQTTSKVAGYVLSPAKLVWHMAVRATEEYLANLSSKSRRAINGSLRKSSDLVATISPLQSNDFDAWYSIYENSVVSRDRGRRAIESDWFKSRKERLSYSFLAIRAKGSKSLLGGAILKCDKKDLKLTIAYAAYDDSISTRHPGVLAFVRSLEFAHKQGYRTLSHGQDSNLYGFYLSNGLQEFKSGLGFLPKGRGKQIVKVLSEDALTDGIVTLIPEQQLAMHISNSPHRMRIPNGYSLNSAPLEQIDRVDTSLVMEEVLRTIPPFSATSEERAIFCKIVEQTFVEVTGAEFKAYYRRDGEVEELQPLNFLFGALRTIYNGAGERMVFYDMLNKNLAQAAVCARQVKQKNFESLAALPTIIEKRDRSAYLAPIIIEFLYLQNAPLSILRNAASDESADIYLKIIQFFRKDSSALNLLIGMLTNIYSINDDELASARAAEETERKECCPFNLTFSFPAQTTAEDAIALQNDLDELYALTLRSGSNIYISRLNYLVRTFGGVALSLIDTLTRPGERTHKFSEYSDFREFGIGDLIRMDELISRIPMQTAPSLEEQALGELADLNERATMERLYSLCLWSPCEQITEIRYAMLVCGETTNEGDFWGMSRCEAINTAIRISPAECLPLVITSLTRYTSNGLAQMRNFPQIRDWVISKGGVEDEQSFIEIASKLPKEEFLLIDDIEVCGPEYFRSLAPVESVSALPTKLSLYSKFKWIALERARSGLPKLTRSCSEHLRAVRGINMDESSDTRSYLLYATAAKFSDLYTYAELKAALFRISSRESKQPLHAWELYLLLRSCADSATVDAGIEALRALLSKQLQIWRYELHGVNGYRREDEFPLLEKIRDLDLSSEVRRRLKPIFEEFLYRMTEAPPDPEERLGIPSSHDFLFFLDTFEGLGFPLSIVFERYASLVLKCDDKQNSRRFAFGIFELLCKLCSTERFQHVVRANERSCHNMLYSLAAKTTLELAEKESSHLANFIGLFELTKLDTPAGLPSILGIMLKQCRAGLCSIQEISNYLKRSFDTKIWNVVDQNFVSLFRAIPKADAAQESELLFSLAANVIRLTRLSSSELATDLYTAIEQLDPLGKLQLRNRIFGNSEFLARHPWMEYGYSLDLSNHLEQFSKSSYCGDYQREMLSRLMLSAVDSIESRLWISSIALAAPSSAPNELLFFARSWLSLTSTSQTSYIRHRYNVLIGDSLHSYSKIVEGKYLALQRKTQSEGEPLMRGELELWEGRRANLIKGGSSEGSGLVEITDEIRMLALTERPPRVNPVEERRLLVDFLSSSFLKKLSLSPAVHDEFESFLLAHRDALERSGISAALSQFAAFANENGIEMLRKLVHELLRCSTRFETTPSEISETSAASLNLGGNFDQLWKQLNLLGFEASSDFIRSWGKLWYTAPVLSTDHIFSVTHSIERWCQHGEEPVLSCQRITSKAGIMTSSNWNYQFGAYPNADGRPIARMLLPQLKLAEYRINGRVMARSVLELTVDTSRDSSPALLVEAVYSNPTFSNPQGFRESVIAYGKSLGVKDIYFAGMPDYPAPLPERYRIYRDTFRPAKEVAYL